MLADGRGRSANASLAQLLNDHKAGLETPAHYQPAERGILTAQKAAQDFASNIVSGNLQPAEPSPQP